MQNQATQTVNLYGQGVGGGAGEGLGISAGHGKGLITMAWTAFALSSVSSGVWLLAGMVSWLFRDDFSSFRLRRRDI